MILNTLVHSLKTTCRFLNGYKSTFLPSATKLRRLCFYTCVSVHRGVCLSACWDTTPPRSRQPPPWEQAAPREQAPPLGAGTPQNRHPPEQATPPQQTATVADGTHPTGMHSCFHNIITCTYKSTCAYITQWKIINTLKQ